MTYCLISSFWIRVSSSLAPAARYDGLGDLSSEQSSEVRGLEFSFCVCMQRFHGFRILHGVASFLQALENVPVHCVGLALECGASVGPCGGGGLPGGGAKVWVVAPTVVVGSLPGLAGVLLLIS